MLGFKAFFSFHRLVFLLAIQRLTLEYFLARVLLGLIYSSSVGQLLTFCTTHYHISLIYVSNFLYT
uniref:Putative ovule protein n=1 Tax=Solanum chacoense TaxID=4108 RepID=A0A0V0HNK2_SOLCH